MKQRQNRGAQIKAHFLPINFRFTLFLVILIVAVFTAVFIISMEQIKDMTTLVCTRMGLPVVEKAALLIDGDAFEKLSQTLDKDDPFYKETQLKLHSLREDANALYLFTIAPYQGTIWHYIIDGTLATEKGFSDLGDKEDISSYERIIKDAMETRSPQFKALSWQRRWGWLIATYIPILNSRGEAVGIIGCNYEADSLFRGIRSQIIRQLIFAVLITALALRVYFILIKQVNRRNRQLIQLRENADAAANAKSRFLANTSQELRAPIKTVIELSGLSLQESVSAEARDYITSIRQVGTKLLSTADKILDFSKTEDGRKSGYTGFRK
ncbi:hypothetical protein AGMMS50268_04620 [Spirochaetia bacterium]|nr:hypothetical protein AGMMS50268_04620 [Spirochaetia bacterium]